MSMKLSESFINNSKKIRIIEIKLISFEQKKYTSRNHGKCIFIVITFTK